MLKLPKQLKELINSGVWPKEGESPNNQEFGDPIISPERVAKVFPHESKLILMPPPFCTLTEERNPFYTEDLTCVGQILYDKAVCIADFGMGADSPIILYFENPEAPQVMYLEWDQKETGEVKHRWVKTHDTFEDFARDIGLYEVIS